MWFSGKLKVNIPKTESSAVSGSQTQTAYRNQNSTQDEARDLATTRV
jgi:hypothetical protein